MLGLPSLTLVGRILAVILAVLGTGRMGIGLVAWKAANALERPTYSVLRQLGGGVELRKYEPYVIAETTIAASSMKAGTGKGFQTVAGYIFGKNKPKAKMKMTAPVRVASKSGGGEKMAMTAPVRMDPGAEAVKVSFVMEKAYSRQSAPAPLDRSVRVKDVASHVLAARTFSGPPPSERRVERERLRILEALESHGLRPASRAADSDVLVYGYHDPFITPNLLRRNEVCVRVEESAALAASA